jgi:hypothetical protein
MPFHSSDHSNRHNTVKNHAVRLNFAELLLDPQKLKEWTNSKPSVEDIVAYVHAVQSRPDSFSIENYSRNLVERIATLGRKTGSSGKSMQKTLFTVQEVSLKAFDRFMLSEAQVGIKSAEKILHASAKLGICHPLIVPALERFYKDRKFKIENANADLDLLIEVARESNLLRLNCTQIFNTLLSIYKEKIPLSAKSRSLHLKRLYAQALVSVGNESKVDQEISREINNLGVVTFNHSTETIRLALLLAYVRPKQPFPRYLEQELIRNTATASFTRGTAESLKAQAIEAGIVSGAKHIFPNAELSLGKSVFMPFSCGPYNCDFVLESRTKQLEMTIAVEINGRQHYCLSPEGQVLKGADVFKERVLHRNSIRVLNVTNQQVWESDQNALPQLFRSALEHVLSSDHI